MLLLSQVITSPSWWVGEQLQCLDCYLFVCFVLFVDVEDALVSTGAFFFVFCVCCRNYLSPSQPCFSHFSLSVISLSLSAS